MFEQRSEIEFVGGPLDGHRHVVTMPVVEMNSVVSFPINRNLFRLLGRRPSGKPHPITSIALYRLQNDEDRVCYRFELAGSPVHA